MSLKLTAALTASRSTRRSITQRMILDAVGSRQHGIRVRSFSDVPLDQEVLAHLAVPFDPARFSQQIRQVLEKLVVAKKLNAVYDSHNRLIAVTAPPTERPRRNVQYHRSAAHVKAPRRPGAYSEG